MNELINQLQQKIGLSEEQAKSAAETVINFLKQKLPSGVSSQLDSVMSGSGSLGDVAKGAGGLFNKG